MDPLTEAKYQRLVAALKPYHRLAVAYSGGVDSTLLVYAACESLGAENVLVLHAVSCLLPQATSRAALQLVVSEFRGAVRFKEVAVEPMRDADFVRNDLRRCYFCKRHIYTRLLAETVREGFGVLADGTNLDDRQDERPGLMALDELGVQTPLVEAGLYKSEIRTIAAAVGLPNAELPANSCLATRIDEGTGIDEERLRAIEKMEAYLAAHGYFGCRVRPRGRLIILELRRMDLGRLASSLCRKEITAYFRENGYDKVLVDLAGRA